MEIASIFNIFTYGCFSCAAVLCTSYFGTKHPRNSQTDFSVEQGSTISNQTKKPTTLNSPSSNEDVPLKEVKEKEPASLELKKAKEDEEKEPFEFDWCSDLDPSVCCLKETDKGCGWPTSAPKEGKQPDRNNVSESTVQGQDAKEKELDNKTKQPEAVIKESLNSTLPTQNKTLLTPQLAFSIQSSQENQSLYSKDQSSPLIIVYEIDGELVNTCSAASCFYI